MKKRILICSLLASAFLILGTAVYCFNLVNDISIKLEGFSEKNGELRQEQGYLEEGSVVNRNDLRDYILFSTEPKGFKEWLKIYDKKWEPFTQGEEFLYIESDIPLPSISKNQCELPYCYQQKLPFRKIPSILWKGLIGVEDIRFIFHKGVDLRSILRALWVDLKAGSFVQGGSTITQQLVKNLYLSNEKTISRKIKEFIIALYIEQVYSKEKILETYLNEFVWGSLQGTKVKGASSAAIFYFGKNVRYLGPYEAAILIAMLKGPYYYHPIRRPNRLRKRVNLIFEKLKRLSLFPANEEAWGDLIWSKWRRRLIQLEVNDPYKSLERASLKKTIELDIFQDFEKYTFYKKAQILRSHLNERLKHKKDIAIKAIIGNPFDSEGRAPFYYYSKRHRPLKKSMEEEFHQVGSLLKPVLYSLFEKKGYGLDHLVNTAKVTLNLKSGAWSPKELKKNLPEFLSLEESLVMSLNGPVIRMASHVGFPWLEDELKRVVPRLKSPLAEFPAQLLGSIELSLKEIYSIYEKFIYSNCLSGLKAQGEKRNVVSALSNPSKGTVRRRLGPLFKSLKYFGKTGTSNKGQDSWYLFYNGEELGIIWVGNEGVRTGEDMKLYGSTTSFVLFQDFYRSRGRSFSEFNCIN